MINWTFVVSHICLSLIILDDSVLMMMFVNIKLFIIMTECICFSPTRDLARLELEIMIRLFDIFFSFG